LHSTVTEERRKFEFEQWWTCSSCIFQWKKLIPWIHFAIDKKELLSTIQVWKLKLLSRCSSDKNLESKYLFSLWFQVRALWLLIWWPLEAYMVVNFRTREISRDACKLARTPTLNKKKKVWKLKLLLCVPSI